MRTLALALSVGLVGCAIAACSGSTHTSGFDDSSGSDGGTGSNNNNNNNNTNPGSITGNGDNDAGNTGPTSTTTGQVDKNAAACDTGLAVGDPDAASFAKAIGICTMASSGGFGLVSASYQKGYGVTTAPVTGQWGLLPKFGNVIVPREGSSIGALSSGYAREYDDINGTEVAGKNGNPSTSDFVAGKPLYSSDPEDTGGGVTIGTATGTAPPGFPQAAKGCAQNNNVNDMIDVKLTLTAPPDASGIQFDFDFYSSEWPNYVCSSFNDAFVAYITSKATTGNISFDSNSNPVAVNNDFFNRCTPNTDVGCLRSDSENPDSPLTTAACAGGVDELGGTGYADTYQTACSSAQTATLGGATGWLTTTAPISPGETFTLEFMIWDAGDGALDSSVLIDNFQWIGGTVTTGTTRVN